VPITNAQAAQFGLLVAAAEAMFDRGGAPIHGSLTPPAAPGVTAAGWMIVAYITGQDTVLRAGPLRMAPETVFYGFVAQRAVGEFVAAIRGTESFVEWCEDGLFVAMPYRTPVALTGPPDPVLVEQGFFALYESMALVDPSGAPLGPLVAGVAALVGMGAITVVGHSLGSALASYLTLDLARGDLGQRASACLFASPHPGNAAFARLFDSSVTYYRLFNYILDIVPRTPLGPDYSPLPRRTVLTPANAEAIIRTSILCNHHVACYCAMLDVENTMAAIGPGDACSATGAPCIIGPEMGNPTIAKRLVTDLAGVIPV
jgi:hypothetical protein